MYTLPSTTAGELATLPPVAYTHFGVERSVGPDWPTATLGCSRLPKYPKDQGFAGVDSPMQYRYPPVTK